MVKINPLVATFVAASGLISGVSAHPGEAHDHEEYVREIAKRTVHAENIARGLANCASNPTYLALQARAHERRAVKAKTLRQKRGIDHKKPYKTKRSLAQRDLAALETFETYNHNLTSDGYTTSTEASVLFANYNNVSCILTPEVTYGPYYVSGEYIRSDVVEDQDGIPVHLEYQYIDVSTCDAATGLYLDTWQANATGVYSGIVASGNGNDADLTNINNTFLRGMQSVDDDGVAAFDTIFVGHYADRASHIHLIAHQDGTVLSNGTYSGGIISHVGQLFFPTDLKDIVEATYPYNTNTQAITTNDEDMWAPDQADNSYDPFPDYAYLGDDIADGLLMWISIGINMSAEYTVGIAGYLTADGGESASGSSSSGTGGGDNSTMSMGGGNGTMTMSGGGGGGNGTMTMSGGSGGPGGSMTANTTATSTSAVVTTTTSGASSTSSTSTVSSTSMSISSTSTSSKVSSTTASSMASSSSSSSVKASSSSHSSSHSSSKSSTTSTQPTHTYSTHSSSTHHSSSSSSSRKPSSSVKKSTTATSYGHGGHTYTIHTFETTTTKGSWGHGHHGGWRA